MKKLIVFLTLILLSGQAEATTLYVKSTGGNSNAAGTWSNVSSLGVDSSGPPTASDDCIADLNSGQLTINAALACKTFSATDGVGDYANTITHNAFIWTVSGSITFVAGMTYTPLGTSTIRMNATGTLTTAGKLLPNFTTLTTGTQTLGDNLSFMDSKLIVFTIGATTIDLNGKTVSGNSAVNRVLVKSSVLGTARTITINSGTFDAADLMDITASSALDLSAASNFSGDCGGNSAITFTTAAAQTYTGGTDNWSTAARWTSRVPLPQDDVTVVGQAGAYTITEDMPRIGKSVTFFGASGTPTWTWSAGTTLGTSIFGSLTLISGMTLTSSSSLTPQFYGRGSFTLTSAGKTFYNGSFLMFGGTLTLQDAMSFTNDTVNYGNGTIVSGGFAATFFDFTDNATASLKTLTLSTATWTVTRQTTNSWRTDGSGTTITASTSTIVMNLNGGGFTGGGKTYYNISAGAGNSMTINDSGNTFNAILAPSGVNHAIILPGGGTTTVLSGAGLGNSGNLVTFTSSAGSSTIAHNGSNLVWGKVSLTNIIASGTGTHFANNSSVDGGGNTGWIFGDPPNSRGRIGNRRNHFLSEVPRDRFIQYAI